MRKVHPDQNMDFNQKFQLWQPTVFFSLLISSKFVLNYETHLIRSVVSLFPRFFEKPSKNPSDHRVCFSSYHENPSAKKSFQHFFPLQELQTLSIFSKISWKIRRVFKNESKVIFTNLVGSICTFLEITKQILRKLLYFWRIFGKT